MQPNNVRAASSWPSEVCSSAASRAMKPSKNRTSCSPMYATASSQVSRARCGSAFDQANPTIHDV